MEDLYMSDVVNILTTIPSTDGNFVSALKRATQDELDEAIVFIEKNPIGQIARKYAILAEKRRRKKAAGQNKEKTTQMDMFQMNGFVDVAASDIPELFADSNDANKEKIIETDDKMETISNQDEVIPMGTTSLMEIMQGISQGIPQGLPKPTEEEILNAKKENSSITEVTNETFLGNNSKKADASNVEYDDVDTSFVDFALSLGNIDSCEYLQVVEKLNREMMHFSDDENLYVLNGLLKAAREDSALARGILNENKLNRCKHWFYHNVWGMLWDINKAGEQVVRYVYSSYRIVVNKKEQSFVMEPWYGGELARVYYDRPVSRANFEAPYGRKWIMSTKHYLNSGGLFLKHDFCGYCYFYPYNQNEWVKEITADKIGTWTYFIFDLSKPERRNFYERLAKVNLGDLARDFIFSYMDPIRSIDLNNTNLLDNLNLNKNTLRILKSCPTIAAWQFLKEVPDITQEKFDKWTKLFGYSAREYNRFKNPMKVCGYACSQNQEDKKGFLNSYINYLDIIEEYGNELGINLKSKSVKYPSDFTKADANLTRDYQELMKKKKAEKEAFFDKNYAAMTEELKAAMCKSKDIKKFLKGTSGLLVKIPETREELIKEGNRLHNCLATYADKMAAGKTTIFFIRKIDDPDKEYFAMEYRDGEIKQLYTYHNHRDESGKVVAFADAFAAMLKESNFEPPKLAA